MNYLKYILIIISILTLFSCSSAKQDYNVINHFLETELAGKAIDTLFVKSKAMDRMDGLKKYEQAYKERNYGKDTLKQVLVYPQLNPWSIDSLEIEQLKIQLAADKVKHWQRDDFNNKELIITTSGIHDDNEFLKHHLRSGNYVLNISQPFYNKNRSYAFFQYYISLIFGGGGPGNNSGLIIMKKVDSKWIQVSQMEYEYYN